VQPGVEPVAHKSDTLTITLHGQLNFYILITYLEMSQHIMAITYYSAENYMLSKTFTKDS